MSNTLIFSDTHLTEKFEPERFNYLKKIIEQSDQVIINGDLWEGYLTTIEKFVQSEWNKLFSLLLEKNAFYIYGNHDREKFCNECVNLFSTQQGYEYKIKTPSKSIHIEHGNRIIPDIDEEDWYPRSKIIGYTRDRLFKLVVKKKGTGPLRKYFHKMNDRIRAWAKDKMTENEILICGHTHQTEYNLDKKYINGGFIDCGYASYIRITDDQIELIEERY